MKSLLHRKAVAAALGIAIGTGGLVAVAAAPAQAACSALANPTSYIVQFHKDANCSGGYISGASNLSSKRNPNVGPDFNDAISSIRIGGRVNTVTVYENDYYRGCSKTFAKSSSGNWSKVNWNLSGMTFTGCSVEVDDEITSWSLT
jgi:hypothetical protein